MKTEEVSILKCVVSPQEMFLVLGVIFRKSGGGKSRPEEDYKNMMEVIADSLPERRMRSDPCVVHTIKCRDVFPATVRVYKNIIFNGSFPWQLNTRFSDVRRLLRIQVCSIILKIRRIFDYNV